jgi:hypothetical protein
MEELIKRLEATCEELELINELTAKYKDIKVVGEKLFFKKLEDGILAKLHLANLTQLRLMRDSYKFRYYDKNITDKLIDMKPVEIEKLIPEYDSKS